MKGFLRLKCLGLFCVTGLVMILLSCHNDPKDDPTLQGRDVMVGTYLVSAKGDVNVSLMLPVVGEQKFTYPLSLDDRTMTITPDSLHEDSVFINVDSLIVLTKGEVIGNKLLINPTKIKYTASDLIQSMNLGTLGTTISSYFGDAAIDIRVYHSTAVLVDTLLTLTTDIDASLGGSSVSLSVDGTLTDTAVKQ